MATLGPARLGRRARQRGRRHGRRPLQRRARRSTSTVACVIVEPVAANMGLVAAGARVPRGPAGRVRPRRRAARSSTRSSPASAWPAAAPRSAFGVHARPHRLRQGHRRRPAGRRLRRPGRRHGRARPARARVPGRHAVGEPAGHRRRPRRARPARRRGLRHAGRAGRAPRRPGSPPPSRRRARRARARWSARWSASSSATDAARPTTPRAQRTDEARYAAFFHAMLDRGVALAPGAYEVMFPGLAHDDDIVDAVVDVAREAAEAVGAHAGEPVQGVELEPRSGGGVARG